MLCTSTDWFLYDKCLRQKDLRRHVNSEVENLKALIDNEFTTIRRSVEDLKRTNLINDTMSLIDCLKEEVAYLRNENIIKTEIIKSLTEKKSTCSTSIFAK